MKLVYNGSVAITFLVEGVGTLEPGDEFTVSDEVAPAFLSRSDISTAKPPRKAKAKAETPATPELPSAGDKPAGETQPAD